jgi:hypothetical protein
MGVWGTAIFSDDNAADLRAEYRTMIGDGLSEPEATNRLLKMLMKKQPHRDESRIS